ncbi:MAG: TlpA family protein disulfide reductase [Gemmatimonadota bacterium]
MGRHRVGEIALNAGTGAAVVAAAALLINDRLLPAWRARDEAGEGDPVPPGLMMARLDSSDSVSVAGSGPALLLVFQSTCGACERNLPAWRELLRRLPRGIRPFAVALEPADSGFAYAQAHMPSAVPVRPADESRFVARLGLSVVPTTLVVDGDRRLRVRLSGVLGATAIDSILRLAGQVAGRPAADPRGSP